MRTGIVIAAVLLGAAITAAILLLRPTVPGTRGPALSVHVSAPGSAPVQNERELAEPIEQALGAVAGVNRIRTRAQGSTVVTEVWLEPGTDSYAALKEADTALSQLRLSAQPTLLRHAPYEETRWLLGDAQRSPSELRAWAEATVRPSLAGQAGVREVGLCGAGVLVRVVRVDPTRLVSHGLAASELLSAIEAAGPSAAIEELAALPVGPRSQLRDLATISLEPAASDCTVVGPRQGWQRPAGLLVTARHDPKKAPAARWDLPGLTTQQLDAVSSVRVRIHASLEDAGKRTGDLMREQTIVTLRPQGELIEAQLLYAPPLDPAAREQVLSEVRKISGAELVSVSGVERVTLLLTGADPAQLRAAGESLRQAVQAVPGVLFIVSPPAEVPQLVVTLDRARLAELGVASQDVNHAVALAMGGVERGGIQIKVIEDLEGPERLSRMYVKSRSGAVVPISSLVQLTEQLQPAELLRVNRQRALELQVFGIGQSQIPVPQLPVGVALELREGD